MRGELYKKTYAYKVFSAGMSAYIAKLMWNHRTIFDPNTEFGHVIGCQVVGFIMLVAAILQVCVNIGLVGDMWDKKRNVE